MRRQLRFACPDLQPPPQDPPEGPSPHLVWPPGNRPPVFQAPVVTYALIAVNVAMWLLVDLLGPGNRLEQLVNPDANTLVLLGGKFGPLIHAGQYWRLVTAMFLHVGILHLAVNMWALLQLGMLCELLYGRARFLILYVCSGVMGNIVSYEMSPVLGVGASGALFGLFGVAIVFSIKYRSELPRGMGDRMLRSLMPVLLVNLVITFIIPIIDKYAHLGGLISGGALAILTESRSASEERREREMLPVPLALLTALGLLAYGAWALTTAVPLAVNYRAAAAAKRTAAADAATQSLLAGFSHSSLPREGVFTLGDLLAQGLVERHRGREAEALYRRLLELHPNDPEALNGLAYFYADVLDTHLDEAERMARKAVRADPNNGGIMDTLAWVYFKEGKLKEAYATQQQAIRLAGNQADVRYHMGAIDEARGDLAAAQQEYETALRLDPRQAEARRALEKLRRGQAPGD